jgi:hypothetical protein
MRSRGFLILGVGADISNVGIRQADNLARVARIGEYFLIPGEARIENDFAAPPRYGTRGASMKNAPVFERKYALPCLSFRQWILFPAGVIKIKKPAPTRVSLYGFRKYRDRTEMIHGPVSEHGLSVDKSSWHRPEYP